MKISSTANADSWVLQNFLCVQADILKETIKKSNSQVFSSLPLSNLNDPKIASGTYLNIASDAFQLEPMNWGRKSLQ